jgi:hypothetical protein
LPETKDTKQAKNQIAPPPHARVAPNRRKAQSGSPTRF